MAVYVGDAKGEPISAPLAVGFDRRVKLQFHGAKLSSDGGLLLYRELDDALGLRMLAETLEQGVGWADSGLKCDTSQRYGSAWSTIREFIATQ